MKTDALIEMLARGPVAADGRTVERRIAGAVACGLVVSFVAMWGLLGPRPDLGVSVGVPMFWLKLLLPVCLAVVLFQASARLARPAASARGPGIALVALLVALWAMAGVDLLMAAPDRRVALVEGVSAGACVVSIAALSLPLLVGLWVSMRSLAPTRPVLAGAAGGALAGSLAAAVYALHCREMALPFLGVWYVLGIAVPAVAGAALGRRFLRWT
jgi:hypothetical protein